MIRFCNLFIALSSFFLFLPVNSPGNEQAERKVIEESLTVLLNRDGVLPLKDLEKGSFACLTLGRADDFVSRLNDYLDMPVISIDPYSPESKARGLIELAQYDRIIAGITAAALPVNYDYRALLNELMPVLQQKESVVVFLGPSLYLRQWRGIENVDGLVLAYNDDALVQDLAAQLIFGAIGASGTMPVPAGKLFPAGAGLHTGGGLRLKYTVPEEHGLDGRMLNRRIDSIVGEALSLQAFPGCRVLAAKGGSIIFDRAYGHHTYSGRVAVEKDDIYDLASVTKISGPLPLYMKLYDEGRVDMDMPLSHYWDDWKNRLFRPSDKEDLVLRDLLSHRSGIVPYINYWEQTLRRGHYKRRWFRHEQLDGFSLEIGSHLYLRDRFRKKVYRSIRKSNLSPHGEYRYSCLPFIISPEVISAVDGRPYTDALYQDFYEPLGAVSLRYNPLHHFPAHRIVPTEVDNNFRRELVHGYVHDEASAVLGGISGNAGLFSNAGDLAKLMQMYLNGGEYGGRRYISGEAVREFARVQFPESNNRRGLGFDKPLPDNDTLSPERAYPCPGASSSSFGHSGFTGTFVWMDPEYDLLYIFLSNRVYPTRHNNLISTLNIRTGILQVFYDAIEDSRR